MKNWRSADEKYVIRIINRPQFMYLMEIHQMLAPQLDPLSRLLKMNSFY